MSLNNKAQQVKRAQGLAIGVFLFCTAAMIWPIYLLGAHFRPFIFGLPMAFAWPAMWITGIFIALITLYRYEKKTGHHESGEADS